MKKLNEVEKKNFVNAFKCLISLKSIAKEKGISTAMVTQILNNKRIDNYNVIDTCFDKINEKLKAEMPSH